MTMDMRDAIKTLVSLPPAALRLGADAAPSADYAGSDPPGRQLGSGGGTVHLLHSARLALTPDVPLANWLAASRKLVIHASGQSRRLPAYAAEGKSRLPVPPMAGYAGQTPGQTLLDIQQSAFTHLLRHAPSSYRVAITCGDTLIRAPRAMPRFPEADVLIVGIPSSPEEACAHGVLFSPVREPGTIEFFLHKPPPGKITELSASYTFSLDSGAWLLSERAVLALFGKCGWDADTQSFPGGISPFDLFDRLGPALGNHPSSPDPAFEGLTAAVLALPDARFYHFGTNRSVLGSIAQLSHPAEVRRAYGHTSKSAEEDARFVLHADVGAALPASSPLWIENATVPASWTLCGENVVTGVPPNNWEVVLPRGACVDIVPIAEGEAIRVYGFDDPFRGAVGSDKTRFLGRPFPEWLAARGLSLEQAGLAPETDIQDAPLFPVVALPSPEGETLLKWMLSPNPDSATAKRWLAARRVSATDLVQCADLVPRLRRREGHVRRELSALDASAWAASVSILDLEALAHSPASSSLPPPLPALAGMAGVHDAMLRSRLGATNDGADAFKRLRELIVSDTALAPVRPTRDVLDDQIIWGRAPARLDLAGGWSDTPPYCIEHGGRVVNVAVDLNGQPPIQAFARICPEPKIILHSIDLGVGETIESFEELAAPSELGAFSIPRAAFRLAGFDPRFHADGRARSLADLLRSEFGGGIELSTLCAIPKGSGLGTSSILAATVLGVIGETCRLGWTRQDLFARTTALEQLLTSGGGWQDQVGGVMPRVKLAMTTPGLRQEPDVLWLPDALLANLFASGRAMLYYTGITRVARSILAEIVRNIFLNDRRTLSCIEDIAFNADFATDAIQHAEEPAFFEAIRRAWSLNCELDPGTCPPAIAAITARLDRHGATYKLLGAGGGGYILILAQDPASAAAIRDEFTRDPPNPRARFVAPSLSDGLQITRS